MTFWAAGAAVVGSVISSNAAGDAADAQAGAAAASDATQRYFYDTTRADNAPFRNTGVSANNRLAYLMGLNVDGGKTREQIRAELLPQFSKQGQEGQTPQAGLPRSLRDRLINPGGTITATEWQGGGIDEAGLNAAIDAQMAAQQKEQGAQRNDSSFGSLSRNFTMADRNADPVYQSGLQFGLDQGTQGINRQAAAGGSYLSGATLKALTRFGNDYGSTKANESYNRFNTNQNQQYNRLAGLSGAGQQATNQVSAAGQNAGNQISASQQGVGNARGSSYLSQGNAWQNGINGAVSAYKNNGTTNQYGQGFGDPLNNHFFGNGTGGD